MKAEDLEVSPVTFMIENVQEEEVGKDAERKLVMSFFGQKKRLILNTTNIKNLRKAFGNVPLKELSDQRVTLFTREEDCFGESKEVIRISATKPALPKQEPPPLE
jgi:hypothetical protein